MSRNNYTHLLNGRTPWRPWVQLRSKSGEQAVYTVPPPTLSAKARKLAPRNMRQHWEWDDILHRMRVLCDWIHKRMDKAVEIRRLSPRLTHIDVFRSFRYIVNHGEGEISCAKLLNGKEASFDRPFEVVRPLEMSEWMHAIIENLNLIDNQQLEIFHTERNMQAMRSWLSGNTYDLLKRQAAFIKIRKEILPAAFKIPNEVFGIALACRARPIGPLLSSDVLNTVWKYPSAFGQVARENPQLLPLLMAYAQDRNTGSFGKAGDPVSRLKADMLGRGISEASWRYVTRHGSRIFRPAWMHYKKEPTYQSALFYLSALQYAKLPPPPPPAIAKALFDLHDGFIGRALSIKPLFDKFLDPKVLQAALTESGKWRGQPDMAPFVDDFTEVCASSKIIWQRLDRNQIKAGWPWYLSTLREAQEITAILDQSPQHTWQTRHAEFEHGNWKIVPIRSTKDLYVEAQAMRNCLDQYQEACEKGEKEIYSIRDKDTGKRRANIGFDFVNGRPFMTDVRGFANTMAKKEWYDLGKEMLRDFRAAHMANQKILARFKNNSARE